MKDLNQYVEELLYKHQCVIIPKFGAFISNRKSAKLFEDKTFAPPKRELTFNASLNSNDGLLMKHIASTSNVEYALVEDYVGLAVEGWKRILQQGEALILPNIGTLRQTPEGRISFEAFEDVNYLTDSFGMSPFVAHEVKESSTLKITENQITPTLSIPSEQEPEPQVQSGAPSANKKEAIQSNTKTGTQVGISTKKDKNRSFLKYTAVAVIGLAILTYGAISFFGEPIENQNDESMADALTIDEGQVEQGVQQRLSEATFFQVPVKLSSISLDIAKAKRTSTLKKQEKTPAKEPKKEVASTPKPTNAKTDAKANVSGQKSSKSTATSAMNKKYYVIAGAFKDEKNANARVAKLKSLGFPNASVIGTNAKGLYQVSYAGFDNLSDAEALKKEVRAAKESKKLDGGWILTNQ